MSEINLSGVTDQIQAEMQVKQFREFLNQYNKLSEDCFTACIWDFTSRAVKNQEDKCVGNCIDKFTKVTQRISDRFQELQLISNENLSALSQKLSDSKA